MKPLGGKAYGSTPHLLGSRLGPGDHHCHQGQHDICTLKARDKHDRIIVTEKLDGSCCAVACIDGRIVALTRSGYLANTSPYPQHHYFAWWVDGRKPMFEGLLFEGEVLHGEWLALAHGTKYSLTHPPFVVFGMSDRGKVRRPWDYIVDRLSSVGDLLPLVRVLSDGPPMSVEAARAALGEFGHHGAQDPVEGAVWRVERKGEFDFLAKFVAHEKQDGKYLADITGHPEHWNWKAAA
jgi:hypothetical protein